MSLEPSLTLSLLPKARLLRWNEEEQEAKEYRDRGICAVAFPSKETHGAAGGESGILESNTSLKTGCEDRAPLHRTQSSSDATCLPVAGLCYGAFTGRVNVWRQPS